MGTDRTPTRRGPTSCAWPGIARPHGTAAPDDTVLVGDTPLDVKAAHDAGARVVAVASGPYGTAELEQAGADVVLADLSDADRAIAAVTAST